MQRQLSLDIFRGLTLAAMLLVNNPGTWSFVYPPLQHAKWHGLTPTDLIFPFFMFIVGAAVFHSMKKIPTGSVPWGKIIKRTVLLFLIGFLLNIFPFTEPMESWRVMGVLQRIALCYGVAAVLICALTKKQLMITSIVILLGYWLILLSVDNAFTLADNLVRQFDIALFGASHLYQGFGVAFDPEGLLSCLPGVVTVLAGYFTSGMLAEKTTEQARIKGLLVWAVAALAVTALWQQWFPINKALWSSTYVLVTSACAWLILALIIYIHDVKKIQRGFKWAQIYGTNPLFVYVLAWIFASTLSLVSWTNETGSISIKLYIYSSLSGFMSPVNASLAFALLFVILFYGVSVWLFKRNIFIKL
ncbi:MAG: heparan-alpha-glucosaminide N-acetyltransferase domain-containing protein [Colwellia sp.]